MEVPIMSSEFCNECRKKNGQGEKEPQKPQKEGSTNEGSSGPPKDGSNNGSQGENKDCKVCWGGDLNNDSELPIMSSAFCAQCVQKQKQGPQDESGKGITAAPKTGNQIKPRGFDYHDWEPIFRIPRSNNRLHG